MGPQEGRRKRNGQGNLPYRGFHPAPFFVYQSGVVLQTN